jgi:hypothetical protein
MISSFSPFTQEAVITLTESPGILSASANILAIWLYEKPGGSPFILDVLATAPRICVAAGDDNIHDKHLADAISELVERRRISLTTF